MIKDLGEWEGPLSRIVNFVSFVDKIHKKNVLYKAVYLKNFFDKNGILVSDLDRILEISNNQEEVMRHAVRCMGFRGKYEILNPKKIKSATGDYNLCILSEPISYNQMKTVLANNFLRAY